LSTPYRRHERFGRREHTQRLAFEPKRLDDRLIVRACGVEYDDHWMTQELGKTMCATGIGKCEVGRRHTDRQR